MGKGQQKRREAAAAAAAEAAGEAPRAMNLGDFMPASAPTTDEESAGLAKQPVAPKEEAAGPAKEPVAPTPGPAIPPCGFAVRATKKGGLPISIEPRNKGKHVTVVKNVSGDLKALLKLLKQAVGGGGVVNPDGGEVEVQGEHLDRVEAVLRQARCLLGVKGGGEPIVVKTQKKKERSIKSLDAKRAAGK